MLVVVFGPFSDSAKSAMCKCGLKTAVGAKQNQVHTAVTGSLRARWLAQLARANLKNDLKKTPSHALA
jgi:hypothetical protein